jgi:hypothetical protein
MQSEWPHYAVVAGGVNRRRWRRVDHSSSGAPPPVSPHSDDPEDDDHTRVSRPTVSVAAWVLHSLRTAVTAGDVVGEGIS